LKIVLYSPPQHRIRLLIRPPGGTILNAELPSVNLRGNYYSVESDIPSHFLSEKEGKEVRLGKGQLIEEWAWKMRTGGKKILH